MHGNGKATSAGRQQTGGHPRSAPSQAAPGDRYRSPVTAADAAQWPYRSFLELGALPSAVPCARLHARLVLREWGLAALSDSTELVVSELVTNAVRVSRAMRQAAVRMWIVSDQAQVVVFVADASPQPPARANPGGDAESGRRLLLVEAISERWGHFGYDGGGKVVWAAVPYPGGP
jgi:anti-sigma regulatory factor (Ser/Thr protein kinase)